jgi:hypothetical protein
MFARNKNARIVALHASQRGVRYAIAWLRVLSLARDGAAVDASRVEAVGTG